MSAMLDPELLAEYLASLPMYVELDVTWGAWRTGCPPIQQRWMTRDSARPGRRCTNLTTGTELWPTVLLLTATEVTSVVPVDASTVTFEAWVQARAERATEAAG